MSVNPTVTFNLVTKSPAELALPNVELKVPDIAFTNVKELKVPDITSKNFEELKVPDITSINVVEEMKVPDAPLSKIQRSI